MPSAGGVHGPLVALALTNPCPQPRNPQKPPRHPTTPLGSALHRDNLNHRILLLLLLLLLLRHPAAIQPFVQLHLQQVLHPTLCSNLTVGLFTSQQAWEHSRRSAMQARKRG